MLLYVEHRYSLLVHHTVEELRAFGLTEAMLNDQMWYRTVALDRENFLLMVKISVFLLFPLME